MPVSPGEGCVMSVSSSKGGVAYVFDSPNDGVMASVKKVWLLFMSVQGNTMMSSL